MICTHHTATHSSWNIQNPSPVCLGLRFTKYILGFFGIAIIAILGEKNRFLKEQGATDFTRKKYLSAENGGGQQEVHVHFPKLQRTRPKKIPKEAPNFFGPTKSYQHNMSKTQKIYTLRISWYVMVCPKKGIILRFHSYLFLRIGIGAPDSIGRGLDSYGIMSSLSSYSSCVPPIHPVWWICYPYLLGPFRFTA